MNAPAVLPSERDRWLAARREVIDGHVVITASDIAAILGEDDRRGPLQVALSKAHGYEPEDNLVMRRGRRLEQFLAEEYQEQTGRPVLGMPEYELVFHPDVPWIACTPDRKTLATEDEPDPFGRVDVGPRAVDRARAPLQIKYATGSAAKWKDGPPLAHVIQVAIEIACCDAEWGALCGMVHGAAPLKHFDLPRHDGFIRAALPRLEAFSMSVARGEMPEADGLPGTTEALKHLFADEDGETIPLDAEALRLADALDQAKTREGAAHQTVTELENRLRARMGSASFGALNDGSFIALPVTKRAGYRVEPTTYRALRRFWPRMRRR